MATDERPGLELEIDDVSQWREVRVRRIAWGLLSLLIVGAFAGLTGGGPLADSRVERGGVEIEWERIVRAEANTKVRIGAPATLARDGLLSIRLGRAWLDGVEVEDVRPEPARVSVGNDHVEYVFAVPPGATTTFAAFTVRPQTLGRRELTIAAADAPPFAVRQFVLP